MRQCRRRRLRLQRCRPQNIMFFGKGSPENRRTEKPVPARRKAASLSKSPGRNNPFRFYFLTAAILFGHLLSVTACFFRRPAGHPARRPGPARRSVFAELYFCYRIFRYRAFRRRALMPAGIPLLVSAALQFLFFLAEGRQNVYIYHFTLSGCLTSRPGNNPVPAAVIR